MTVSIDSVTADQLTASILARRAGKPGAVQFEKVTDTRGDSTHVVSRELLIRTADYAAHAAAFAGWTTKAYLDGLLTRLTAPANQAPALKPLLDGIPAVQPNAVVPSGAADPTIVWKRATPPTPPPAVPVVPPPAAVGPRVAVLDTGIPDAARTDPSLAGLQHANADNRDPLDAFPGQGNGFLDAAAGHGVFVTGILRSAAPLAAIDVRRVLDSEGIGSELDLAVALLAAVRAGARVVNVSAGLETYGDRPPLALTVALELIAAAGTDVVVVAAAGNSGQKRPVWPAAFPGTRVIAVGALTRANEPAPWSSFGDWVDCSAPGEKVVSTYVTGTQDAGIVTNPVTFSTPRASWTGTSFAAPRVAGQIAAIVQATGLAPWDAFKQLVDNKELRPGHGYLLP